MPETADAGLIASDQAALPAALLSSDRPSRAPAKSTARRSAGRSRWRARGWYRLISPVVAIGLWQAASSTGILPASKLASPASIAHTAYTLVVTGSPAYGTLQESLLASCERWAVGLAIGVAVGVLLAVLTGLSRIGEATLDPILQALRSVPLLGLIPLFIVWFGIGELPKVLFVVLSALFPMYINTFAASAASTASSASSGTSWACAGAKWSGTSCCPARFRRR